MAIRQSGHEALKLGAIGFCLVFAAPPAFAMTAAHGPSAHHRCAPDDPMAFDDGPTRCRSDSAADPMNFGSDFLAGKQSNAGSGDPMAPSSSQASSNAFATGQTGSIDAQGAAQPVNAVAAWFKSLSDADQERILINAAHEGLTDDKGQPFSPREFLALSAVMDQEMEKKGLTDAQKRQIFQSMEQKAGVGGSTQ